MIEYIPTIKSTYKVDNPEKFDERYEEKTIFTKGILRAEGFECTKYDSDTGFTYSGLDIPVKLRRKVEMYQWVEHENKSSEKTTYTYIQEV